MKSIIQTEKRCYITGRTTDLEEHHIFYGKNRKKSEQYGLKVWLAADYHRQTKYSIHGGNVNLNTYLKQVGQRAFNEYYPDLDFLKIFGRNYL